MSNTFVLSTRITELNIEIEDLKNELHDNEIEIAEFMNEVQFQNKRISELKDAIETLEKIRVNQTEYIESMESQVAKVNAEKTELEFAIEMTINRMLRQTITGHTHGERNQQLRHWSRELLTIIRINEGNSNSEDVPF